MEKRITFKMLLAAAMLLTVWAAPAQNIPNPVLPGVADAGVIKYNGRYYIGGVRTDGDFYHSADLVKWEGPVHVLTMDNEWTKGTGAGDNQIHANDMIYIDGTFHIYWSVNHWGDDRHIVHIAHAESDSILGPYHEPQKDTWMDNRIDPKVFRDDDGKLYMYMVRFTDGNTIWVRPMKDARTFEGPVLYQYASLPGTWERMDNRVIEGPWVIKYRDRYYMMFNGNHTGTNWGNYQLGVAEADSPVTFNNGTKYPYPLLLSNQVPMEEEYVNLLQFNGAAYDPLFSYTTAKPSGKWQAPAYDDSSWEKGMPAFASNRVQGSTVRKQGTQWDSGNVYVRKTFMAGSDTGNLALRIHHDGPANAYLNGELIYSSEKPDYLIVNLGESERKLLRDGNNVLAAETSRGARSGFLDIALFDLKEGTADDILYSPGQPNIVRGPNGFEWWLVYMANKNREPRGQYINRIHFFGKTMYADNVTSNNTKGYFPVPSKPTFGDLFDNAGKPRKWIFEGAEWTVSDGEMHSPAGEASALLSSDLKASAYLFEAGVNTDSDAGVIAWWRDKSNWLKIGIDASSGKWFTRYSKNGKVTEQSHELTPGFKFGVYHTLSVERNYDRITLRIDDLTRTPEPLVMEGMTGEGVPGLFAAGKTAFDGVTYTVGWDEFDKGISNWADSASGEKAAGTYEVTGEGMKVLSETSFRAFKGDALSDYEYSLQLANRPDMGTAGVYAAYVDRNNYISVAINYGFRQLETRVVKDGLTTAHNNLPLQSFETLYADMRFTDSNEKGYRFDTPTWIDALWLNRIASNNDLYGTIPGASNYYNNAFIDNMFDKLSVEYTKDGKWFRFSGVETGVAPNPMYSRMTFDPVKADGLRFINRDPRDQNSYIYKIRANEISKESYNIRCVKKGDTVIVFVDGKEMCRLDAAGLEKAQAGVFSDGCRPVYNGIQRYDISQNP